MRSVKIMIDRYGDAAVIEAATRADKFASEGSTNGRAA